MVYYVCKDGTLEKYKIDFDEEELLTLREEIISKCSYITHEIRELRYDPTFRINGVRNVVNLGLSPNFHRTRRCTYYRYSYDIYKEPYLVTIIDQLISGNMKYLYDLDNPHEEVIDWNAEISQKRQIVVDSPYPEATNEALKDLKLIIEKAELNANQENPLFYYDKVNNLISRQLVATINVQDAADFAEFWNIDLKTLGPVSDGCSYGPKRLRHKEGGK